MHHDDRGPNALKHCEVLKGLATLTGTTPEWSFWVGEEEAAPVL